MKRLAWLVTFVCAFPAASLDAQALGSRVVASDGLVDVVYPSRPDACGDGKAFIGNILGRHDMHFGDATGDDWSRLERCIRGPARVRVTVISGDVTRLRPYVGPVPAASTEVRTIEASAADATSWLGELVTRAGGRVASQAVIPLVLADGSEPWPLLLRVARADDRPRDVRRAAMQWLSSGVIEHLGLEDDDSSRSDDDQIREQAVFVLSQRPKSESVPELIELARHSKHPDARRAAIFWLGQSGDARAIDVYEELLNGRR